MKIMKLWFFKGPEGNIIAKLPTGKTVLPSRKSKIAPGVHVVAVQERENFAIANPINHDNTKFFIEEVGDKIRCVASICRKRFIFDPYDRTDPITRLVPKRTMKRIRSEIVRKKREVMHRIISRQSNSNNNNAWVALLTGDFEVLPVLEHVKNRKEGTVYRVGPLAFTRNGNGYIVVTNGIPEPPYSELVQLETALLAKKVPHKILDNLFGIDQIKNAAVKIIRFELGEPSENNSSLPVTPISIETEVVKYTLIPERREREGIMCLKSIGSREYYAQLVEWTMKEYEFKIPITDHWKREFFTRLVKTLREGYRVNNTNIIPNEEVKLWAR